MQPSFWDPIRPSLTPELLGTWLPGLNQLAQIVPRHWRVPRRVKRLTVTACLSPRSTTRPVTPHVRPRLPDFWSPELAEVGIIISL